MSDQSPHSELIIHGSITHSTNSPSAGRSLKVEPELQGKHIDTLVGLAERGPVECGDVPSKSGRDDLLQWGYAIHTVVKGEDGWYAITPAGVNAYLKHFCGDTVAQAMANRKARK